MLEFTYNKGGNLLLVITSDPNISGMHFWDEAFFSIGPPCDTLLSITYQTNQNLLPSQKYLILLHNKLGRSGFQWCKNICQIRRIRLGIKSANLLYSRLLHAMPHCVHLVRWSRIINAQLINARLAIHIIWYYGKAIYTLAILSPYINIFPVSPDASFIQKGNIPQTKIMLKGPYLLITRAVMSTYETNLS